MSHNGQINVENILPFHSVNITTKPNEEAISAPHSTLTSSLKNLVLCDKTKPLSSANPETLNNPHPTPNLTTQTTNLSLTERIINPNLGQPLDNQIKKLNQNKPLSINNIMYPKPASTCECNHNHFNHINHDVTNF